MSGFGSENEVPIFIFAYLITILIFKGFRDPQLHTWFPRISQSG